VRIDLHTHSTASDGTDTPAELVRNARAAGLDVVALTDHDSARGHAEAIAALQQLDGGLTLVTGAELSCRLDGTGMHMLAYLFDPEESEFARERELVRDDRVPRAQGMVAKLQELGVPIEWARVAAIAGDASIGRPHIAEDVSAAFTSEWLANDGRAYVDKHELDPFTAIRLVKAAGGVTVFAHPGAAKRGDTVPLASIAELAAAGLDGIEVDHMDHDEDDRVRLRAFAAEHDLLVTGSSDYHGSRKTVRLGEYTTHPDVYGEITRRATGAFPVPGAGGSPRA
jgi:predicted metal-dependent phosphoesterase TrpH